MTSVADRKTYQISDGLSIAFTSWPEPGALGGGTGTHTGLAFLDLDDDRDLDVVLSADGVYSRLESGIKTTRLQERPWCFE